MSIRGAGGVSGPCVKNPTSGNVTRGLHGALSLSPVGSGWDAAAPSPDRAARRHLNEWIDGSACHPALAAANVATLFDADALQALAGDRLEQLGGHAQQYVTASAARLLRPLESVAAAGGWWCSGLDPLADWAPMAWGCFKPDAPRLADDGKPLKYEHPHGVQTRSTWLRVPAVVAQLVGDRFRLSLPPDVAADADGSAGAFWRWWAKTPALPLLLSEGSKKAAALLSVGVPAAALPGIDSGAKRTGPKGANGRRSGPLELLPDLAGLPLKGRQIWALFDASTKANPREPIAARRLGQLLKRAGADVMVGTCPGTHGKGADDHLVNGGTWEQLAQCLAPLARRPVSPHLRAADAVAPAGQWLGIAQPIPAPEVARLVALAAPMGAGKTEALAAAVAPMLAVGQRVVLITHRRSLGAALAERLGLPWGEDAEPDSPLREQGVALCIDSLCPESGLQIRPGDWRGCVVVIDEVAAVLAHGVNGTGTAIANRRPDVLETIAALLAAAEQVIVADAQLSTPVLDALEAATGTRALLIASEHKPAAGRQLVVHPSRDSWRAELVNQLQARRRMWVSTTAREKANGAQNLALLAMQHWPEARVLVVDSATVDDENHDASKLAADPNGIAGKYDLVIASPAVAAGLSVTLQSHFQAVMAICGGTTDPDSVAQAMARVRDDCPRHLFAPQQSPGAHLRTGSGDTDPTQLLRRLGEHEAATVAQLLAAGGDLQQSTTGPWLPLWAQLGALRNAQRLSYRATCVALLEREGYVVTDAAALTPDGAAAAKAAGDALKAIAAETQAAADAAVIAAEPLTAAEATKLARKRKRTPAESAQLARHRVAVAWGLGASDPTPELLEADRNGRSERGRFGQVLQNLEDRQLVAGHDRAVANALAPRGKKGWAPDLCRETIGPKVAAADAIGLAGWLGRSEWFTATDQQLQALQALAIAHAASMRQVLGVSPGERATTTLRNLLHLAGYRLEAKRSREDGNRAWRYRVVVEPLPDGADHDQLVTAWRDQLNSSGGGLL